MKKRALVTSLTSTLLFLAICQPAAADDDFWVGVKAGTLGLGLEATWRPVPYLDVRGGFNGFSLDDNGNREGIEYDGTIDLNTFYATANLRVPLSPFRVTAGIFSNNNEIELTSRDTGTIQIGNNVFNTADVGTLTVRGDFDKTAAYAGAGFDFRIADTFGLHFDAGVLMQGSANVSIEANGPLANEAAFLSELENERIQLQNDVEDYELYPVASIGFSVNF